MTLHTAHLVRSQSSYALPSQPHRASALAPRSLPFSVALACGESPLLIITTLSWAIKRDPGRHLDFADLILALHLPVRPRCPPCSSTSSTGALDTSSRDRKCARPHLSLRRQSNCSSRLHPLINDLTMLHNTTSVVGIAGCHRFNRLFL